MDSSVEKPEDKLSAISPIQAGNIPIEDKTNELAKEKPNKYLQKGEKESNRQYKKKVKDYGDVVSQAKKYGIDLEHKEGMPLTDTDKEKIKYNLQKLAPAEMMGSINDRINALSVPQQETRPDLDTKRLLEEQKKIRRARFADSLTAFGAGLQGKNIDPDNFYSNKLARKRDAEFQMYKDVTDRNKKARDLWNVQSTNEVLKWLEEEKENEKNSAALRQKYQQMHDFHKDEIKSKYRGFAIQEQRYKDEAADRVQRNKIEATKAANAVEKSQAKENKPVIIQTSDGTSHSLQPEVADRYRREVLNNPDKYPSIYDKVQVYDEAGFKPIPGEFTYKLKAKYKDSDIVSAYLETQQNKLNKINPGDQAIQGFNKANKNIIPTPVESNTGGWY